MDVKISKPLLVIAIVACILLAFIAGIFVGPLVSRLQAASGHEKVSQDQKAIVTSGSSQPLSLEEEIVRGAIDDELVRILGVPLQPQRESYLGLNYRHHKFRAEPLSAIRFPKRHPFRPSIQGQINFFDGQYLREQRNERIAEAKAIPRKLLIEQSLGIDGVSLQQLVHRQTVVIAKETTHRVAKTTLTFSSGAVIETLIATPTVQSRNAVILALHGCSSDPQALLGIGQPDYSNQFALAAVQEGYTVVAPAILSLCNFQDDFSGLGNLTCGITAYGYELLKLKAVDRLIISEEFPEMQRIVWGISMGGALALYVSHIAEDYKISVLSGAASYDYFKYYRDGILPLRVNCRTPGHLRLMSRATLPGLVTDLFPKKVILEIGAFDRRPGQATAVKTIMNAAAAFDENPLHIVYAKGRHESFPSHTLPKIRQWSSSHDAP